MKFFSVLIRIFMVLKHFSNGMFYGFIRHYTFPVLVVYDYHKGVFESTVAYYKLNSTLSWYKTIRSIVTITIQETLLYYMYYTIEDFVQCGVGGCR